MKRGKMIGMIAVWIAVFAVLAIFLRPTKNTAATAKDGSLVITGRSGYSLSIVYAELTEIEYRDEMDYGTMIEGTDTGKEKSGRWENAELGTYLLCVNAKIKPCIILRDAEGTKVINYESEKSTEALYKAISEQMNTQNTGTAAGKMLSVTTKGFVDVDGVKLSEIDIRYDTDLKGAEIDRDTYSLEIPTGSVLENFGNGSIGDITDIRVDGDTVKLSLYTAYHLNAEASFASALAVRVTQVKDIKVGDAMIAASEEAVDNYATAEENAKGHAEMNGKGRQGGPGGMRGSGKSAAYGSYTIEGIEGFLYFTDNTSYGTPDGEPFKKEHCFSEITGEYSDASVSYALFVPENYDASKKYAMVTVQNPAAMEGTHPIASVLETRGPSVYASAWAQQFVREQHPELDGLIVVVPTVTERVNDNGGTPAQYEAIVALWDDLIKTYSVDPNYIYGSGQSVGGMIVAETNRNRDNFFAGIWLFEDQWGQNYNKDSVFARGMMSDGYQETAQNTPRHYYRTDPAITWDYYFDADGKQVFDDWDPYNYLYLISDDNILITNRSENLLSNDTWQELAFLYHDTVGYDLSRLSVSANAPVADQVETIRAYLQTPDRFEGQERGIRWVSFTNGANGYSCRRTDAGYEWLLSQTRETEMRRDKLDINKPFVPAEVQNNTPERVLEGFVDAATGDPIYYLTAKENTGTGLYNTCLLILGNGGAAKADANPGWLPEGMRYPLTAGHIVSVTPISENGEVTSIAVEYDAELDGLIVWLKGDGVLNSRGQTYDDYFVTMEPYQLLDASGNLIESHIANAYVNSVPDRLPNAQKGEGSGCYVILELEQPFATQTFFLKQTASIHTEQVIAMPGVRLYKAE